MEKRNYNSEIIDNQGRKYAYSFDYDVIHPMMMRAFEPYFKSGSALELGCFQGRFTKRICECGKFTSVSCIEASSEALVVAKEYLSSYGNIEFINSTFEEAAVSEKYDNVFLTHVLEHIDDRVSLLNKINDQWLSEEGVLFIACPNANAPSRQIAVNMGLVEKTDSVTDAEALHGHRVTYSMETLRNDIKKSRLEIVHSSGIFFKALANYQWDLVIANGIVDENYLNACYELGHKYPDLCSSIYYVCKKQSKK